MYLGAFSTDFRKILKTSHFIKILPFVADLFHMDGRADRHDEANSLFQNYANAPKMR